MTKKFKETNFMRSELYLSCNTTFGFDNLNQSCMNVSLFLSKAFARQVTQNDTQILNSESDTFDEKLKLDVFETNEIYNKIHLFQKNLSGNTFIEWLKGNESVAYNDSEIKNRELRLSLKDSALQGSNSEKSNNLLPKKPFQKRKFTFIGSALFLNPLMITVAILVAFCILMFGGYLAVWKIKLKR